jgi:hypothetical protein
MVIPVQFSDEEAKHQKEVNGFASVKESEAPAIRKKADYDNRFFFDVRVIVHLEFVPRGQTVSQEFYISILRCMRGALRRRSL